MLRSVVIAATAVAVAADFVAPEYNVDLDKPAYEAWGPVVRDLMNKHGYENAWGKLHDFLEKTLSHKEWVLLEPMWEKLLASYPPQYQEEVRAFNKLTVDLGHPWTLGQNVMVNLFYEVEDACTSIVAQNANGTIFHARNLDYGLPGLENFTATVTLRKGGKGVARGTMYVGYSGLLTGQHLSGDQATWSVSIDQRFYGKDVVPYVASIKAIEHGVQNIGFMLRDGLVSLPDYQTAVPYLSSTHLPAPAYLIAAGVKDGEGAVITRDRNGTSAALGTGRGFWSLDTKDAKGWYRLETNFDNWQPLTDGRRKAAHESMDALGSTDVNIDTLFSVLSKPPVLADDTTYTATMINDAGYYRTVARTHPAEAQEALLNQKIAQVRAKLRDLVTWYKSTL